jgi:AcrR family transcriptional regulator
VLTQSATTATLPPSRRDGELLAVTLRLLQAHGYERLTVEAVAATAKASKATLYRRWPTKAELVLAAFVEGVRHVAESPDSGTLRGDLLQVGDTIRRHACAQSGAIRAVLVEISHNPALADALQRQFLSQHKAMLGRILQHAVERGEIAEAAIDDELWDLLPGYLIYRSVLAGRPPTRRTVAALVDDVLIPSLHR